MVEASKKKARAQVRRASTPAKQLPKRLKMSPASTIVVDRPWQVERRRKVVQGLCGASHQGGEDRQEPYGPATS